MRTREEDRLYRREYRARKRAEAAAGSTTVVTDAASTQVFDAVKAELAPLPVTVTRPGLVAAALAMTRVLDDPAQAPHHPAAARSLGDILARLHSNSRRGETKLAAMRVARHNE
jgi:hypothetical protein